MGSLHRVRSFLRLVGSVVALRGLSFPMAGEILVPQLGIKPMSPVLQGGLLTTGPPGKAQEGPIF